MKFDSSCLLLLCDAIHNHLTVHLPEEVHMSQVCNISHINEAIASL